MPVMNGQLQAVVNGQLQSVVNGQLLAVVNGELMIIDKAMLVNGQLMAVVNGQLQAIVNGQLMAVVNGQLLAMVNGQLMAVVNGELTFALLINGQLMAVVNGQLQALVNGQLMAVVNGSLQNVESYTITNGQLQAVVNGQPYTLVNGQLQAVVNGQLQAVVNNFAGIDATNNSNAAVVIDRDDILVQQGAVGGLFSTNMITSLNAGVQKLLPGALFDPNFEITYGMGEVTILPAPLTVDADWKVLNEGAPTPPQSFFTSTIKGLMYNDQPSIVTGIVYTLSPTYNGVPGVYIIQPGSSTLNLANYRPVIFDTGRLYVNPYGPGAKKILVKTECVRALTPEEVAQYGSNYRYMALFTYNNRNATPVYIPRGQDNFISIAPGGTFRNALPEVFEPGLHEVYILFSGQKMVWELRSLETVHKTAVTSEVNANSPKCQSAFTTMRQEPEQETEATVINTSVYPNPAHDRVRVHASVPIVAEKELVVVDANGRQYQGLRSQRIDENTLELSVTSLSPGLYLVRVKTTEGYRTLRFTKL
ncbi:MAG TPA: T9SS type A sorting domain-containing protein, partial [Flavisolibacter sp.]|nr:T9SS type A sorting domain-containing protein [Flavisolibacter sp.]